MSAETTDIPKMIFRKGPRVILRPHTESDLEPSCRMINDPRNSRFLTAHCPFGYADQRDFILSTQKEGEILLAIESDGAYIGNMGMRHIDHMHGHAETGSLIGLPEYQGKGYGTEAKLLLLEYAFNTLGLRKVYSQVFAFNGRSLKYAEKCGYQEEARLQDHFFAAGEFHDKVILSVDRARWQPLWDAFYANHKEEIIS